MDERRFVRVHAAHHVPIVAERGRSAVGVHGPMLFGAAPGVLDPYALVVLQPGICVGIDGVTS